MKALTVWQPWATLIAVGAKPYEFRRWDYRKRARPLLGQRIAIHAGAREMRGEEFLDLVERVNDRATALVPEKAAVVLSLIRRVAEEDWRRASTCLPLSAVLATAVLGEPVLAVDLFKDKYDSDRLDHSVWAWPLSDVEVLDEPIPYRGAQGFWNFPSALLGSGRKIT